MPIYVLNSDKIEFPNPESALREPNGLLAVGGDLSVKRLLAAYKCGVFPWFNINDPILWWSPNPRGVLYPDKLRINRSLRRVINKAPFELRRDYDFTAVIKGCAAPREDADGTWITPEMQTAYINMHKKGYAHSYECWSDGELQGGLYGVRIGDMFFAESMFRRASNASKMAVYFLCQDMLESGGKLIDIQILSPHLENLGAREIGRKEYIKQLKSIID
jgi:leucyl/phenylalanyl-tRNA---protein transferase